MPPLASHALDYPVTDRSMIWTVSRPTAGTRRFSPGLCWA